MFAAVARNANALTRNLAQTVGRRGYNGGVPGENLPFDISNPYKLTFMFMLFFGSGLGAPFLIVRHQLIKHQ